MKVILISGVVVLPSMCGIAHFASELKCSSNAAVYGVYSIFHTKHTTPVSESIFIWKTAAHKRKWRGKGYGKR